MHPFIIPSGNTYGKLCNLLVRSTAVGGKWTAAAGEMRVTPSKTNSNSNVFSDLLYYPCLISSMYELIVNPNCTQCCFISKWSFSVSQMTPIFCPKLTEYKKLTCKNINKLFIWIRRDKVFTNVFDCTLIVRPSIHNQIRVETHSTSDFD
jgi:hypothetical protein